MGGGTQSESQQNTLVQGPTPEAALMAGQYQVSAANQAAQAAKENTALAINYLRDNSQQGMLFNQMQTNQGLGAVNQAAQSSVNAINTQVQQALNTLTTNFAAAKQVFGPYQQTGLQALDQMTAMLGLSGKPSAMNALGELDLGLANKPVAPNAPIMDRLPLDPMKPNIKSLINPADVKEDPQAVSDYMWSQMHGTANPNARASGQGSQYLGDYIYTGPKSAITPTSATPQDWVYGVPGAAGSDAYRAPAEAYLQGQAADAQNTQISANNDYAQQLYNEQKREYDYQVQGIQDKYNQDLVPYNASLTDYNKQLADYQAYYGTDPANQQTQYDTDRAALVADSQTPALTGQQIYDQLAATPGYQFQLQEGLKGLSNQASTKGLLYSGALLKGLDQYGQGLAQQTYGQRLSDLANLVGMGYNATGQVSNLNQQQGVNASQLQANQGSALASIYGNQGNASAGLLGGLGSSSLGAYQNLGSGLAGLQSNLGDSLGNAALARGQAQASSYLAANQQVKSYVTGTSSSSSSPGIGGALSGVGSILGAFSSKKLKKKTQKINPKAILESVKRLTIDEWAYNGVKGNHIGPYAEDFKKEFNVGDGTSINLIDSTGVLFAALKALSRDVDKLKEGK